MNDLKSERDELEILADRKEKEIQKKFLEK
jgi:hypothetical protein